MAWTLDIFFLIYLLFFVWRHRIIPFGMPEIVEAAILLPFSAMCYVGILTDAEAPEIRHLPTFWLVTGCLLYFMFLIPFVLISEYYSRIGKSELSRAIFSMNGIVLIACYFFYFKSITCWRTT
ncbi:MAG: hypothetical protein P4L51_23870 [Puia sp.]|nr:hypothetical protein [Puia sp.]